jgi:septal ring-binding cell division protein DamX
VSAVQHPNPPGEGAQAEPEPRPERRCRRCGSALGPAQEWCLACGAAVTTTVAPPRGWRAPIALAGALAVLALAAIVLAIVALARGPEQVAQVQPTATPAPTASAVAPPGATVTPAPSASPSASASPTATPTTGAFAQWPAGRSAWTVVLESNRSRAGAERVARDLQAQGAAVGLLDSDDHGSLRAGYWVVFSGQYPSRQAAEDALPTLPGKSAGAYVRRVSAS